MQAAQDVQIDSRISRTQYQYTLTDADVVELSEWAPKLLTVLRNKPELTDVASDQQSGGLQVSVDVDREQASRLNVLTQAIDDTLYDAFGQRQVSTIFTQLNQYRVILEVEPQYQFNPESLNRIYVKSSTGQMVPLSAFAKVKTATAPLTIVHQGQFPAVTLSFNLRPGGSLGEAVQGDSGGGEGNRPAGYRRGDLLRQRGGIPILAQERAVPDPGRHHRDLHRPGGAL